GHLKWYFQGTSSTRLKLPEDKTVGKKKMKNFRVQRLENIVGGFSILQMAPEDPGIQFPDGDRGIEDRGSQRPSPEAGRVMENGLDRFSEAVQITVSKKDTPFGSPDTVAGNHGDPKGQTFAHADRIPI